MDCALTTKVVLLLSASVLTHYMLSPPTPSARQDSRSRFGQVDTIGALVKWIPFVGKVAVWTPTLCEVAVILAITQPSTPATQAVVKGLTFDVTIPRDLRLSPVFLVGWTTTVIGTVLRLVCYRQLGRQFTYNLSIIDEHRLVTHGLYSVVRHPSYTAWILFAIGLVIIQTSLGSWIVESGVIRTTTGLIITGGWLSYNLHIVVMLFPRMRSEDEVLRKQFGDQWRQWAKITPYKLVPGIY
ncbi:hypothetical protein C8Q78DRAFT_1071742 [Trametes maxima]|nr:hypothetical protein C8Q78DRAFT_1071742 [Trametes maxima]